MQRNRDTSKNNLSRFCKTPLTDKNNFKMPMIISAKQAGQIIYDKLTNSRDFEIVFPKLFGFVMKSVKTFT